MDWRKIIEVAVGAAAEGARQAAGAHWDREQAEAAAKAAIRALPADPPRQAIDDADRAELERIADGDEDG
jgi:hypothetical protein